MSTKTASREPCTGHAFDTNTATKLASIQEVADYLGISARTLYNARSTGRSCPPAIKVLGQLRWRWSDVQAWVDSQAEGPAA